MPSVRIMNWNIQTLSDDKIAIGGMADALAEIIVGHGADILVVVELRGDGATVMKRLSGACRAKVRLGTPASNDYSYWFSR